MNSAKIIEAVDYFNEIQERESVSMEIILLDHQVK
jgi:hypothetical protein